MAYYKNKSYNQTSGMIYNRRKSLDSIKSLMEINPRKAKSELYKHLQTYPDDMYAWFYYGKISQAESNLQEAEDSYRKVAESDSKNKYAGVTGLGDIARIKGDTTLAKKYYYQSIRENKTEQAPTYYILARLETNDRNYEAALKILKSLPMTNTTKIELLRVYTEARMSEEAETLVKTIIPQTQAESRSLDFERAKMAIAKKKYAEAALLLMQAKSYPKKDEEYYKILTEEARLAVEMENFQLAIDNCEEALSANEIAYGFNYQLLGIAKQALGQYKSAMDCFKMGKTQENAQYQAKSSCSYHLGCLEMIMGDYEKAEQNLKESILPNMPPRYAVIELLLNIYLRQNRCGEAKKLLETITSKYPSYYDKDQIKFATMMIDKKMGKDLSRVKTRSYRENQVISYNEQEVIEHIKKHHQGEDITMGIFSQKVDIKTLMKEIKPKLTSDNITVTDMMDRYFVEYPNIGYNHEKEVADSICVVVFPGTKDILTMYPEVKRKMITKKDIMDTMDSQSAKVNSRVNRFNSRFANFTPPTKK